MSRKIKRRIGDRVDSDHLPLEIVLKGRKKRGKRKRQEYEKKREEIDIKRERRNCIGWRS